MSVPVIAEITQQNGGTYPVTRASRIAYNATGDITVSVKDKLDGYDTQIAALTTLVNSANADIDGGNFTDTAGTDVISGGDF